MSEVKIDIKLLSTQYEVRKISDDDTMAVLKLCEGNPLYYRYCPPAVSMETIRMDLCELPPDKTLADKYYVGFFKKNKLIAVMDLISQYPNNETAFIGFFMINIELQRFGIGTSIISECLQYLKSIKVKRVRLGYVKDNPQPKSFWRKNHFEPTGEESLQEFYTVVVMERVL